MPVAPDPVTKQEFLLFGCLGVAFAIAVGAVTPGFGDSLDVQHMHALSRAYLARALGSGELPLWNPHMGLGRPFLANVENNVLYPPTLMASVLRPSAALLVSLWIHGTLCLCSTVLFARALGVQRRASVLCGLVFLVSAPLVGRALVGQVSFFQGVAYVPLVMYFATCLVDRPSRAGVAKLAAAWAMQCLGATPQVVWLTALGVVVFAVARTPWGGLAAFGRGAARSVGLLLCGAAWAAALAAAQLLPLWELGEQAVSDPSLASASAFSLPWRDTLSLVVAPSGERLVSWEHVLTLGVAPVVAGCAGLASLKNRNARGLLALALLGAALALGDATPAFRLLHSAVPGVSAFQGHAQSSVLVVLSLTLGAGLALSAPATGTPAKVRTVTAGLAATAAIGLALFLPFSSGEALPPIRVLATLAAGTTVLLWLERASFTRTQRRWLLAAVAAGWAADATQTTCDLKRLYADEVTQEVVESEERLMAPSSWDKLVDASPAPLRVGLPRGLMRENLGLLAGHSTPAGYVPRSLRRVWTYQHGVLGLDPPLLDTSPDSAIQHFGPFPYRSMSLAVSLDPARAEVVTRPRSATWTWPHPSLGRAQADPRAFVAPISMVVANTAEALELLKFGHDLHRQPLIEAPPGAHVIHPGNPSAWDDFSASAEITEFAAEHVQLTVRASQPGVLVLGEAWYPGWDATVNGVAERCYPANVWARAVAVPAGESTIVLTYRSRFLVPGALLSLVALIVLLIVLVPRRSDSQGPQAAPPS
ncbi:YfhO family protein [Planctomycetota bacterium]|nr:YfhO family protein [Planctomycetota bacterium]